MKCAIPFCPSVGVIYVIDNFCRNPVPVIIVTLHISIIPTILSLCLNTHMHEKYERGKKIILLVNKWKKSWKFWESTKASSTKYTTKRLICQFVLFLVFSFSQHGVKNVRKSKKDA